MTKFQRAMESLAERGIQPRIDPKTSCLQFFKKFGGIDVKLAVVDNHDTYIQDFLLDDRDEMPRIIEDIYNHKFVLDAERLSELRECDFECGECEVLENEIDELTFRLGTLESILEQARDYTDRFQDFSGH